MRFRRGFRRRRRATWGFSDAELLQCNSTGTNSWAWLLPPGRVNYLCNTDRVSSIMYMGTLLWLDQNWTNTGTNGAPMPDLTMYVLVAQQGEQTPFQAQGGKLNPFAQPSTPSAVTSWSEEDIDGTDSFLWVHHIKGTSPPNALVVTRSEAGSPNNGDNQYNTIDGGSSDNASIVCRVFDVRAAWQPDVHIKSRRRLRKDEGIALWISTDTTPSAGVTVSVTARFRTLVQRGR